MLHQIFEETFAEAQARRSAPPGPGAAGDRAPKSGHAAFQKADRREAF